jgi:hypothetical protein
VFTIGLEWYTSSDDSDLDLISMFYWRSVVTIENRWHVMSYKYNLQCIDSFIFVIRHVMNLVTLYDNQADVPHHPPQSNITGLE